MRFVHILASCAALSAVCSAQLTQQQKIDDFRALVGLYAKQYGPYEWKRDAFGFDLLELRPWLDRIQRSRDDIDYYDILVEYVASLQDSHDLYVLNSTYVAQLGFHCDLYDGKPLIDFINRNMLPVARYPFVAGDELVSIDGKPAEELMREFLKFNNTAWIGARRRSVTAWLTTRVQALVPRAPEVGESARVVIRRSGGSEETYTIPWIKSGRPITSVGPVLDPRTASVQPSLPMVAPDADPDVYAEPDYLAQPDYMRPLLALGNVTVPPQAVLNVGSRAPLFALPEGFRARRGQQPTDNFFSGTFAAAGLTIGYIRIPRMTPLAVGNNPFNTALTEFAGEIAFFQQNTDGLIVDVMRNPGGQVSYVEALCQLLIPSEFRTLGFEVRATLQWLLAFDGALQSARQQGAPQWVLDLIESIGRAVEDAYREKRGRTGPLPVANVSLDLQPAPGAYTKPLIVLADEFSASGGDMLPAILQDNNRGPIVGMRTNGAGGNVVNWPAGSYAEGSTRITQSLMNRKNPVVAPDIPTSPYVENVGVWPDIRLDIMTRDNLVNAGRPFVAEVTRIMVEHVRR
jgi:hypothetical protein